MILQQNRKMIIKLAVPVFVILLLISPLLNGPVLLVIVVLPALLGGIISFYLIEKLLFRFLGFLGFVGGYLGIVFLYFLLLQLLGIHEFGLLGSLADTWF
jgi:hypothetical protein